MVALLGDDSEGADGARLRRMTYHTIDNDGDLGLACAKDYADETPLTMVMGPLSVLHSNSNSTRTSTDAAYTPPVSHMPHQGPTDPWGGPGGPDLTSSPARPNRPASDAMYDSPSRALLGDGAGTDQRRSFPTNNVHVFSAYNGL